MTNNELMTLARKGAQIELERILAIFPDLRTNVEISNTQKVLDGDLDAFIEASLKQGV